ncbi:MAG: Hsp20/alpha crystallin family protein [Candidatus Promineifilaceae bacterium]|nr:Hsp20/alpha crystallin family protein [Candidatus Promineifilaceae bacterium]
MSNEIDTQKQEVEDTHGAERTRATRVYVPKVDIYSNSEGIVIIADMPGVDEKELEITLEKDVLTLNGYVSSSLMAPEGYELVHGEYGVGDFHRSFTLPDEIDRDQIAASLNNGVLKLSLPKAPEAQVRKITVQTTG